MKATYQSWPDLNQSFTKLKTEVMKQKINVQIHKRSDLNGAILTMVAANNEGLFSVNPDNIIGFLLHKKAEYPSLYKKLNTFSNESNLHISEDEGDTNVLSLEWVEVHELITEPQN